jgi:UDP-glucose 4-epimerase
VASAFISAADSDICGEVMNVGSGSHYSIKYLVSLLGGGVIHIPKRPGEPDCTFADTSKIKKILGWSPKVSFEDGVAKMLACINDWKDAPVWNSTSIENATSAWFKYLKK